MADYLEPPADDIGRELHAQLLAGSRTAFSRIADAYYPPLVQWLIQTNPGERDAHLLIQAATDALISLSKHPERFDPDKGGLLAYLRMSATGDYRNSRKSAEIQARRYADSTRDVEDDESHAEEGPEYADDFDLERWVQNQMSPVWDELSRLFPDEVDRSVLQLMMDGVRSTEPYAIVLGIRDLPEAAQAHEVKKTKDRIRRKVQRNLDPAELRHDD